MKDNLLEEKIVHSFDDISVEDMDELMKNIDPCDFSMKDGILGKRIEKKVLKDTKAGTRKHKQRYRGLIAAAVVMICTVSFFSLNVEARELLKKLFSFIPGIGVVESDTSYYVLDENASSTDALMSEDGRLRVKVKTASVQGGRVEVRYVAEMMNADSDVISGIMVNENQSAAEINNAMADYYKQQGYGDYFDISVDTEQYGQVIRSSGAKLCMGDREYPVETSSCIFGEASGWKNLDITDVYNIDAYDASCPLVLKIGDISIELTFAEASAFETKEELNRQSNACTREDVTLVADPVWADDAFYVDVYVSDHGQYSALDSLWAGTGCVSGQEESYPYIKVGDRVIVGSVDSERAEGYHFVFSYDEIGRSDSYELHIPVISMTKDEELTFELGEKNEDGYTDGRYERKVMGQSAEKPTVERVQYIPEIEDANAIRIDLGSDIDNGRVLSYYKNAYFDGEISGVENSYDFDGDQDSMNYVNLSGYGSYEGKVLDHWMIVPVENAFDNVKSITLKNAVYDLSYDFTFELNR